MAGTALVTGGSGYIAGFLIRQLIDNGWHVHTTVRSLAREAEVRGWLGVDNEKLSFFAADLEHDAGWAEAIAGCTHVAHVASPFPLDVPKHADDLVVPAREGALRALRFARAAGVQRFVLTSSMAAIAYGHGKGRELYNEADWTDLANPEVMPYPRSKTVAERAARDWIAAEGGDIEFASVNPAAVFGPLLSDDLSTSIEVVKQLLEVVTDLREPRRDALRLDGGPRVGEELVERIRRVGGHGHLLQRPSGSWRPCDPRVLTGVMVSRARTAWPCRCAPGRRAARRLASDTTSTGSRRPACGDATRSRRTRRDRAG